MARARPVRPAGPQEKALYEAVEDRYSIAEFARLVAQEMKRKPGTEKKAFYRIVAGKTGNASARRIRAYGKVMGVDPTPFLRPAERRSDAEGHPTLESLAAEAEDRLFAVRALLEVADVLVKQVIRLGGRVPAETRRELALATVRTPRANQPT